MDYPHSVLVILAHPTLDRSAANLPMVEALSGLTQVYVHDIYEVYPDFFIDIDEEQKLVEQYDTVVLQHPLYWYSCPALLKEWIDLTFEYGWAYGTGKTALTGKKIMSAITVGGQKQNYRPSGRQKYYIEEFLPPFDQTARLCGMTYLEPFVFYGSFNADSGTITRQAEEYRQRIIDLRDGKFDKPFQLPRRNRDTKQSRSARKQDEA